MDKPKNIKTIRSFTPPPIEDYADFVVPGVLDVEIGCGVGMHPIQYQKESPQRFLVAIEHTREKFEKFQRRYLNHGSPESLLPVHANAISWVSQQLPIHSVDRYFFLYPNPNPKPGDLNKRWYAMPFMHKLLETLKPGGLITLATNEEFYKAEAKNYFQELWGLNLIEDKIIEEKMLPRTHFEKKYLERGEVCYNLVFSN